jgi:cyclin G-associated kinase
LINLGGRLYERVVHRTKPLEVEQVIQIYYQICQGVKHMHKQEPPIIHRDLKVENCLLTSTGFIQLCDFGSATTKVYLPDETWSVKKRDYVEDEMTKVTTPMYRAPEMLDTYNNHPINEQVDIWVKFGLKFFKIKSSHF